MNINTLSHHIFNLSNQDLPRLDFLRKISTLLVEFSNCDAIELWLREKDTYVRCQLNQQTEDSFQYQIVASEKNKEGIIVPKLMDKSIIDKLRVDIIRGKYDSTITGFTKKGSFWTNNMEIPQAVIQNYEGYKKPIGVDNCSFAIITLIFGDKNIGILQLMSNRKNYFTKDLINSYERVVLNMGIAIENQRSQAALRERVKELTCLYKIAQLTERKDMSLEEVLQCIVEFIPPAWQYPEITAGRIFLDGHTYSTSGFQEKKRKQTANIIVNNNRRGIVTVVYQESRPKLDEGPFIKEERNLINTIAKQIALIVEQREVEKDRSRLQEQLRHADRLATIGQLAAGVAHELNEPLGNILGFAQLTQKTPDLSDQIHHDLDEIVNASIHAREVIKKLMLFARQMPYKISQVNLNKVVENSLSFLESRCTKSGIEVKRLLIPNIPEITGDEVQLNQVLVNLVVNSIQAMESGGKLTIKTSADKKNIFLLIEDTGIGIKKEEMKRIFLPFFTTKDVSEGTGLGLSVVHGIVASHKGSINVESQVGQGTRFKIKLPITPS